MVKSVPDFTLIFPGSIRRHEHGDHLTLVPPVNPEITIHGDDGEFRETLAEADQTEVREIGIPIPITPGEIRDARHSRENPLRRERSGGPSTLPATLPASCMNGFASPDRRAFSNASFTRLPWERPVARACSSTQRARSSLKRMLNVVLTRRVCMTFPGLSSSPSAAAAPRFCYRGHASRGTAPSRQRRER